jgi:hypothetical protein
MLSRRALHELSQTGKRHTITQIAAHAGISRSWLPVRPYPVLAADGRNDLFERIVSGAGALRIAPAGAEKSVIVAQSKDLGRQIALQRLAIVALRANAA